jgi:hypothetical protein
MMPATILMTIGLGFWMYYYFSFSKQFNKFELWYMTLQVIATIISVIGIQLLAHEVNTLIRYGAEKTGDEIHLAARSGKSFKSSAIGAIIVGIIWFGNLWFFDIILNSSNHWDLLNT